MNLISNNTLDIERLHALTRRSPLYQRSEHFIWTDDHVGREMLRFHLDPSIDSSSLKHSTIDAQVRWIAERVGQASGTALLDIGCGPGLYCERFHGLGFRVTGVDFNRHSLEYANRRALEHQLPISYEFMNYIELPYREQYDVVTLINRDFCALTATERNQVLRAVFRSLRTGGRFIFDAFSTTQFERLQGTSTITVSNGPGFWAAEPHIVIEQDVLYLQQRAQLNRQIVITASGEMKVFHNWLTYYAAPEIERLLQDAGFELQEQNPFLSSETYDDPELYLGFVAVKP
ncbi:MAG: methyltransferase domain-containing protein [Spirochaetaceae bacterium]|nr:methyltransferase domain-containing protein [Spirochaetaceae bacterium]